jgi:PAS domain S-box-containing protein
MAKRILVVDDSPIELKLTARILGQAGYEIIPATSGAHALALARESRPDLVLLDLNMPEMDGYEVCRRLKEDEATRAIPVVLYSVRDQVVDVLRGLEVGAEEFIVKGMRREDLLARISRILSGSTSPEIPPLDLSPLDEAAAFPEAEPIAQLLEESFRHHVRPCVSMLFGIHPAFLLIERALRQAAERSPLLASPERGRSDGTLFDPQRVRGASSADVIDAFKAFARELLRVTAKLTTTRIYGLREMDELVRAFKRALYAFPSQLRALQRTRSIQGESNPPHPTSTTSPLPSNDAPLVFTFLLDAEGILQSLDEAMANVLGYSRDELLGTPLAALVPESARELVTTLLQEVSAQGMAQRTLTLQRSDGTLISVALSSHALFDRQGRFILSQHRAERLPEDADARARERERLVAELQRTHQALRQLQQEQEAFWHIISHDLRQPLQIIVNAAQLLEEESGARLSESAREYLSAIKGSALRLNEMIGDLVKLSRIRTEALHREPTDVRQLLEEILETLQPILERRNGHVILTGQWPIVHADPAHLRLVFFHLIENALTFNDKPRPLVEVGCLPPDEVAYTFYVRDNGIGIEPKHWERIFRVFQRLHTAEEHRGRGMGLAFCKRIVEAHGGRIWVESEPNAGSTFYFTLPRDLPSQGDPRDLPTAGSTHEEHLRRAPVERLRDALSSR